MDDKRASFAHYLSKEDAEDLRWYFSRTGLGGFWVSSFAQQLARVSLYTLRTVPCRACGGNPDTDLRGTGWTWTDPDELAAARERERIRYQNGMTRDEAREDGDRVCKRCGGTGRVPAGPCPPPPDGQPRRDAADPPPRELTARPTGSSVHGKSAESVAVGEAAIHRLGVVARRLAKVAEVSVRAVEVLALDESDEGNCHFALWPETPAGKTLLRAAKRRGRDPWQVLDVEVIAQRTSPNQRRGMLLSACAAQADTLYQEAVDAWNLAIHPPKPPDSETVTGALQGAGL